jgi:hypothetical protein
MDSGAHGPIQANTGSPYGEVDVREHDVEVRHEPSICEETLTDPVVDLLGDVKIHAIEARQAIAAGQRNDVIEAIVCAHACRCASTQGPPRDAD